MSGVWRARVAIVRFGIVAVAEVERQRDEDYRGHRGWAEFVGLVDAADAGPFESEEVARLLVLAGMVLDQFDEEPTGEGYYPFKALELIELHCRTATGDLADNAPVGLDEWIDRFAHHIDWHVERSQVEGRQPDRFRELERTLWASRVDPTVVDDVAFREAMAASRAAAGEYVTAIESAGRGDRGARR